MCFFNMQHYNKQKVSQEVSMDKKKKWLLAAAAGYLGGAAAWHEGAAKDSFNEIFCPQRAL